MNYEFNAISMIFFGAILMTLWFINNQQIRNITQMCKTQIVMNCECKIMTLNQKKKKKKPHRALVIIKEIFQRCNCIKRI